MKYAIFTISVFFFTSYVYSQTTLIPDPAFENKLISLGIDLNGFTGDILNVDAEGIQNLFIQDSGISNLVGIEAFVDLEWLECEDNLLSSLDLSSNPLVHTLDCQNNQLTSINLTQNTLLVSLSCQENQLTGIDLSNNSLLSNLSCQNNSLADLVLFYNTELYQLICHGNDLSNITFPSSMSLLQVVYCYDNQIQSIDLTNASGVAALLCQNNQLEFLDLRNGNNTAMQTMDSRENPDLAFICVDDVTYSSSQSLWTKDSTSTYSETCVVGVEELILFHVSISPNPVVDFINVKSPFLKDIQRIELINAYGLREDLPISEKNNLSRLAAGYYFLKISMHSGQNNIKKFVKK